MTDVEDFSEDFPAMKEYKKCFRAMLTMFPMVLWIVIVHQIRLKYELKNVYSIFILEYLAIVFACIFNTTVLNEYIVEINVILLIFAILLMVNLRRENRPTETIVLNKHLACLTLSRSSINVFTSVCILAVDFKIFPTCFGKSRTFGVGLMDNGIGLFVWSAGIVWKNKLSNKAKFYENAYILLKEVIPLFVLGVARVIIIRLINYHQDITEYGRDWNAFITIAITRLIGNYIIHKVKLKNLLYVAVGIVTIHEFILHLGLRDFVFDSSTGRETFIRANREGIFSIPGLVALYLFSVFIGQKVIYSGNERKRLDYRRFSQNILIILRYVFYLLIAVLSMISVTGTSRRVANAAYVIWISLIGTSMIGLFMIYEKYLTTRSSKTNIHVLLIMEAVNYNGLFTFILSNVLTGLVNKTVDVDKAGPFKSLWILCTYVFITYVIVCFFYKKKIKVA